MTERADYRPDLDGLRAIAVTLVLLYHARVPPFGGGYVGVDVFFVLSGFLITRNLVGELARTGRISFPAFYARRARRLLPASMLTLLVTAVLSALLLPPVRMPDVAGDIAAAAAYVSNLRFAAQATDYLASELPPSPVLHFWSLGVEEQFYLCWPLLLAVVGRVAFASGAVASGIRRVTLTQVAVLVASAALGIWLTQVNGPWAFFSLPSRAWELALGGLLAMPLGLRLARPRLLGVLGWVGIAMIVAAGLLFDEATPFPGTAAFLPTIGSALVIAAGLNVPARPAWWPAALHHDRLLSLAPMRVMGRISYSLYLWHWPLLVLPAAALGDLSPLARLGLVGLAIVVALASERWVERPIRHGQITGTRPRRVLAMAGSLTVLVVMTSLAIGSIAAARAIPSGPAIGGTVDTVDLPTGTSPRPGHTAEPATSRVAAPPERTLVPAPVPADLSPSLVAAKDDLPSIYGDGCHLDPGAVESGDCAYGDAGSATTVVLFGDSHAAQWFPTLERLAREDGWRLVSLTKSGCPSVDVAVWSDLYARPYTECDEWRASAFDRIARERPRLVVVTNARDYSLAIDGARGPDAAQDEAWAQGLARTIDEVGAAAARVLLVGDTPRMEESPPTCLSANLADASACATPYDEAVSVTGLTADNEVALATGAAFVDPTPWICFTEPCGTVNGRVLIYRDTHHMTATYARALAAELRRVIPPR